MFVCNFEQTYPYLMKNQLLYVATNITQYIKSLKNSDLIATCLECEKEFRLKDSFLFDGTKQFKGTAELTRQQWEQNLETKIEGLKKLREKIASRSRISAATSGGGQMLEKILPALKNFQMVSADWRFLGSPIDNIQFHGLSKNKIESLTFMEVKSGGSKLDESQKQIRDAVNDHRVKWRYL